MWYVKNTPEGYGTTATRIDARFQVYPNLDACFRDYGVNITTSGYYEDRDMSGPVVLLRSIAHHYCTDDPDKYADGVLGIMEKFDLYQFD